ncbi:hypothetical protein A4G26_24890 [Mycobacterium kansasii]|uniref:hypothetical protein n=1 Tax=Mycobacterium innocens TaxID=2341083 RepID=UPI0007BEA4E3|nr:MULTISPECIES: hypothetical protein [Mycobacterium]KZS71525.1 hypothetical protein A4G26_24890 [Mycobacterium kansasii]
MITVHERVLLDTSVVIDYPTDAVAAHAGAAALSTITLAQLSYGLHTEDPLLNLTPRASSDTTGSPIHSTRYRSTRAPHASTGLCARMFVRLAEIRSRADSTY